MLGRCASTADSLLAQQQSQIFVCKAYRLAVLKQRLSFASQAQPSTAETSTVRGGPPRFLHHEGPPKIIQHRGERYPGGVQLGEAATPTPPQPGEPRGPDTRPPMGSVLDLDCVSLSATGKGVCKTEDGFVIFVPRALPGERLQAEVTKLETSCGRGSKLKTLVKSPDSVEAPCRHFRECGGCSHQELSYAQQLAQKQRRAIQTLQRLGGLEDSQRYVLEPVGCAQPLGYRNKLTFTVDTDVDSLTKARRSELGEHPTVGLHKHNNPGELVEIQECLLQDEAANQILTTIKQYLPALQTTARTAVQKVVIRQGSSPKTGERQYMVVLHTTVRPAANPKPRKEQALAFLPMVEKIRETTPALLTLFNCQTVMGRENTFPILTKVWGADAMYHVVNGVPFRTNPNVFFQVNTHQAGKLVDMVFNAAGLRKGDILVDLFCGAGLLAVSCAKRMLDAKTPLKHVYGYEVYNQAVANARTNAVAVGMNKKNFLFKSADLSQPTLGVPIKGDVVICDPARAGLGDPVIDYLFRCKARTLVYVACDLATQARDLKQLCNPANPRHFTLESVQICDMFPQTSHVESVAVLRRLVTWHGDKQKNAYVKMKRVKRDEFLYDKSGLNW